VGADDPVASNGLVAAIARECDLDAAAQSRILCLEVNPVTDKLRARTARGLAKYIRRQLAAARRSGDPRKIAAAQAEVTALRAATRSRQNGDLHDVG